MSLKKVREWVEALRERPAGAPTETAEELRAQWKEMTIQTITGCLLDGNVLGFRPEDLIAESHDLYGRVRAGKADLDMDWLEGRKPYPTAREPNQRTSAATAGIPRPDEASREWEHEESLDEDDELELER
jgi:hypothetical protein